MVIQIALPLIVTIFNILPGSDGIISKPENVSMLVLLGLTGDAPRKGESCYIATEIVVEEVNRRSDFLPGYRVIPIYRDEGPGGLYASEATTRFRREYESADNNNLQAAVMVGPYFSAGCAAAGPIVSHLDITQSALGCNHPAMTANRRTYPNMFKLRSGTEMMLYSRLRFIREIGKWNRFGILANTANNVDYVTAYRTLLEGQANGFEIPYFDVVNDVDDSTIEDMKRSNIRVVIVQLSLVPLIMKFLCLSYQHGMTGGRYAFIMLYTSYIEPTGLPEQITPTCSRQQVWTQFEYLYWIGWAAHNSDEPEMTSSLGYSLTEFDRRFDQKWLAMGKSLDARPADYDKRHICHDGALEAVLALDAASKTLSSSNMTLSDYRQQPTAVMKVVNASLAQISYVGLRIGKFQYSARLEPDDDVYIAVQWTQKTGQQILSSFRKYGPDAPPMSYASYTIRKDYKPPVWFTPNKQPPRDRNMLLTEFAAVPGRFFWSVVSIVGLTSIGQTAMFIISVKRRKRDVLQMTLTALACLLYNASALFFAFPFVPGTPKFIYFTQRVCPIFAFAVTQSCFFSCLFFWRRTVFSTRSQLATQQSRQSIAPSVSQTIAESCASQTIHAPNISLIILTPPIFAQSVKKANKFVANDYHFLKQNNTTLLFTLLILLGTCLYMVIWMGADPPLSYLEKVHIANPYNEEADTFLTVHSFGYRSSYEGNWLASLIATNCAMIAVGSWFAYELRKVPLGRTFTRIRLALPSMGSLLCGVILICLILENNVAGQLMAMSVGALILSVLIACIIFWPAFSKIRPQTGR